MLLAALGQYFFGITIFVLSSFLVLLVLVQRGRGGGLTGALGGPGGQSAFGTKAGDLFTRITVVVAAVWIFACAAAVYFLKEPGLTGITGDTIISTSTDSGEPSIGVTDDQAAPASVAPTSTDEPAEPTDPTTGAEASEADFSDENVPAADGQ